MILSCTVLIVLSFLQFQKVIMKLSRNGHVPKTEAVAKPNDVYIRRTPQLTSKRCILNIYSTNILTEYFKHAAHSPFFFLSSRCRLFHNATFFGFCTFTF